MTEGLPYRLATLCYLFDDRGRVLLLHRRRPPNQDLYSPIGGKLHMDEGESPTACALREIREEADLEIDPKDLHLTGMISEAAYEGACHWLLFLFEVTRPVAVQRTEFHEGRLEWHSREQIDRLDQPATDRQIIWPLFWRYRGRFFAAHIHCEGQKLVWRLEQPIADVGEVWASTESAKTGC